MKLYTIGLVNIYTQSKSQKMILSSSQLTSELIKGV